MNSPEEYLVEYTATKSKILMQDDISLMKQIAEKISSFPGITNNDGLITLEADLIEMSFRLASLIGRLSSQYEIGVKEIKNTIARDALAMVSRGEEKSMTRAETTSELKHESEKREMEIFGGIVDEYKSKSYLIKDLLLAVTHRIHHFNKQQN